MISGIELPGLFITGLMAISGFYIGKMMKWVRLPSIIGYMLAGILLGPSLLSVIDVSARETFSFLTDIALGFVAVTIGLELDFSSLKKQGGGIVYIILAESFGAFLLVTLAIYLLTRDMITALILGALAPSSAPAGVVAIIQEYRARGSLTKAIFAVVGFDDGIGIIIFGFVVVIVRSMLYGQTGVAGESLLSMMLIPLGEIVLSFIIGSAVGFLFCVLGRKLHNPKDILILIIGFVFILAGVSIAMNISYILTNLVMGILIVNTQPRGFVKNIGDQLSSVMPLFFILFFVLAGSNLHLEALPSLGLIGIVYIISRSAGLIIGSRLGAVLGGADEKIKKYLGIGIISQAGVAIGLALVVRREFAGLGTVISAEAGITTGDRLGFMAITVITATSVIFEIIGPILAKIALSRAGEINAAVTGHKR